MRDSTHAGEPLHRTPHWRARYGPLTIALIVTAAALTWIVWTAWQLSGGPPAYPFDDTYIHMTVANRLVEHGVWGVNPSASVSASSSPVWTILLAAFFAIGLPADWVPLLLNVLAAIGLLVAADAAFRDVGIPPFQRALFLVAVVALVPLPSIAFIGMEHTLHASLSIAFLLCVRRIDEPAWRRRALALAALLPLVRLEALALIGCTSVWLFRSSKPLAVRLAAAAAAPVAVFAMVSLALGWWPLPNSVMLKFRGGPITGPWQDTTWGLVMALKGFVGLLAVLLCFPRIAYQLRREAVIVIGAVAAHVAMGGSTFLHRYDAYLAAMLTVTTASVGWAVIGGGQGGWPRVVIPVSVAAALLIFEPTIRHRAQHSFRQLPVASRNIGDQQREAARFVREFLTVPGPVVLNDLGAIAYSGGRDVIDLIGLGSTEIGRTWRAGEMSRQYLADVSTAAGAHVAIVYDIYLGFQKDAGVPPGWTAVGRWTIAENIICGHPTVTVYAIGADAVDPVRRSFQAFARTLQPRSRFEILQ